MTEPVIEGGCVLMSCPACGESWWEDLIADYCDDHFGGHAVSRLPEDAPCPACDEQGEEVEA